MTKRRDGVPADVPNVKHGAPSGYAVSCNAVVLLLLAVWAWVELNYRPHAYQAPPPKVDFSDVRMLAQLTTARRRFLRKRIARDFGARRTHGVPVRYAVSRGTIAAERAS
jgi:hypothetical protein